MAQEFLLVTTADNAELIVNTADIMCLSCVLSRCYINLVNSSYTISKEEYDRLKKVFIK